MVEGTMASSINQLVAVPLLLLTTIYIINNTEARENITLAKPRDLNYFDDCPQYTPTSFTYPISTCSTGQINLPPGEPVPAPPSTPKPKDRAANRLMYGNYAPKGKFPSAVQVLVQKEEGFQSCSGWILTQNIVVTSGRCLYKAQRAKVKAPFSDFVSTDRNTLCPHPNTIEQLPSRTGFQVYDYGVIILEDPIKFDDSLQPACLAEKFHPDDGTIVGFGEYHISSPLPLTPVESPTYIERDPAKCYDYDHQIYQRIMCFKIGPQSSTGTYQGQYCIGDEGAPVYGREYNSGKVIGMLMTVPKICKLQTGGRLRSWTDDVREVKFAALDFCTLRSELLNLADFCYSKHHKTYRNYGKKKK